MGAKCCSRALAPNLQPPHKRLTDPDTLKSYQICISLPAFYTYLGFCPEIFLCKTLNIQFFARKIYFTFYWVAIIDTPTSQLWHVAASLTGAPRNRSQVMWGPKLLNRVIHPPSTLCCVCIDTHTRRTYRLQVLFIKMRNFL